jgi:hypothetical protein
MKNINLTLATAATLILLTSVQGASHFKNNLEQTKFKGVKQ